MLGSSSSEAGGSGGGALDLDLAHLFALHTGLSTPDTLSVVTDGGSVELEVCGAGGR